MAIFEAQPIGLNSKSRLLVDYALLDDEQRA